MTLLTTLRHAKSSWDDRSLDDFDRTLNDRGRKAARRVGRELRHRKVRFDHVIASPAVRVRETIRELEEGYGEKLDVSFEPQVYEASADTLLHLIRRIPGTAHAPLLVGHNPGLERLVANLTRDDANGLRDRVAGDYPTAALAVIKLPVTRWDEVEFGRGTIVELILPRELD